MNTRIQVEHPVTEVILGLDLVAAQIRVGRGDSLDLLDGDLEPRGHAIELRINAEDPYQQFRPSPGLISEWRLPGGDGVRVDTHCYEGYVVPPFYDSMLAKLIVSGKNRADAISRAQDALGAFHLQGVASTVPVLDAVIHHEDYKVGAFNTAWLEELTDDTAKA
jgi:acetyl-CoA carboxylase biotin carboxylase subunit